MNHLWLINLFLWNTAIAPIFTIAHCAASLYIVKPYDYGYSYHLEKLCISYFSILFSFAWSSSFRDLTSCNFLLQWYLESKTYHHQLASLPTLKIARNNKCLSHQQKTYLKVVNSGAVLCNLCLYLTIELMQNVLPFIWLIGQFKMQLLVKNFK